MMSLLRTSRCFCIQLSMQELLQPAIQLAENGYPVAPITSFAWQLGAGDLLRPDNAHGRDMLLPGGRPPKTGEVMRMPLLAKTFKVSASKETVSLCK